MAKYLGTNDREMLDDAYERVTLHLEVPPYPTVEGVAVLLKTLEKAQLKRVRRSRKISSTRAWCASSIRAAFSIDCRRSSR